MGDYDPDDWEDLVFLWDVWYNEVLPETTKKRIFVVFVELLEGLLEPFVHVLKNSPVLKDLWQKWKADFGKKHEGMSKDFWELKHQEEYIDTKINVLQNYCKFFCDFISTQSVVFAKCDYNCGLQ